MHYYHTTISSAAVAFGKLEAGIASLNYRLLATQPVPTLAMMFIKPLENPPSPLLPCSPPAGLVAGSVLARTARTSYLPFHSKVLHELASRGIGTNQNTRFARGFSSFLRAIAQSRKGVRLIKD
jgi:hypothetical protein